MENQKITGLAKNLLEKGLAFSMYEATEKAKNILSGTEPREDKVEQEQSTAKVKPKIDENSSLRCGVEDETKDFSKTSGQLEDSEASKIIEPQLDNPSNQDLSEDTPKPEIQVSEVSDEKDVVLENTDDENFDITKEDITINEIMKQSGVEKKEGFKEQGPEDKEY